MTQVPYRLFLVGACLTAMFASGVKSQERVFAVGEGPASALAISPDGNVVAIDALDFKTGETVVIVFDIKAEKKLAVFRRENGTVQSLAFSKDGKRIISTSGKAITVAMTKWRHS